MKIEWKIGFFHSRYLNHFITVLTIVHTWLFLFMQERLYSFTPVGGTGNWKAGTQMDGEINHIFQ